MNKYDIVRYIGEDENEMFICPKKGEIAIITSVTETNETTLLSVEWKGGNGTKKVAWFDIKDFELVKKFEW